MSCPGRSSRKPRFPCTRALGLLVKAEKRRSSCRLARALAMSQQSAWEMQPCIRAALPGYTAALLQDLGEADATDVGGQPRRPNKKATRKPNTPGRGTTKTAGVGEGGGEGVVKVGERLTGSAVAKFLTGTPAMDGSPLLTEESKGSNTIREQRPQAGIPHEQGDAEGPGSPHDPCRLLGPSETLPVRPAPPLRQTVHCRYPCRQPAGHTTPAKTATLLEPTSGGASHESQSSFLWSLSDPNGGLPRHCRRAKGRNRRVASKPQLLIPYSF